MRVTPCFSFLISDLTFIGLTNAEVEESLAAEIDVADQEVMIDATDRMNSLVNSLVAQDPMTEIENAATQDLLPEIAEEASLAAKNSKKADASYVMKKAT